MSDESDALPGTEAQPQLFDTPPEWAEMWRGMPEYSHEDLLPWQTVLVHFETIADRERFAKLVGQELHSKTKFLWYPKATIRKAADKVYTRAEKVTPKYPVYILSKGRWDTRLTAKCFEWIQVPYHICVEPQEYEQYAAAWRSEGWSTDNIFMLPFSNLGQGGIPARNWIWNHAASIGAERHWIFDDNIDGFCRFQDNLKVEVDSGVTLKAIEDFVDRYENVAMAGFNYDYFAPRKQGSRIKPITLNTRIYSGILIRTNLKAKIDGEPVRWRGRYNEDTDLSLRVLKDGWTTVLFNAFLMYKRPTLTMKGGNTDELYRQAAEAATAWATHLQRCTAGCHADTGPICDEGRAILSADGRWLMADSLKQQHPDCVRVSWKWDRWQHEVDYSAFKDNKFLLRPDVVVPDGDQYAMALDAMPRDVDTNAPDVVHRPVRVTMPLATTDAPVHPTVAPAVSALDFAFGGPSTAEPAPACPSQPEAGQERQPASAVAASIELPDQAGAASGREFQARLLAAGHRLLTRDGKLFVSEASRLSDDDRAFVKANREELLHLAEPWTDPSLLDPGQSMKVQEPERQPIEVLFQQGASTGGSLAQFLGTAPARVEHDYVPDEPPVLDGISHVILNFATDGLEWWKGKRPVGVTVSTLDGQMTRFLPFRFAGGNLDEETIKRWAQEQLKGKHITNANTRFDVHHAREWGIDLEAQGCMFSDIQHTAALLDDQRKKFALDVLAAHYLPGNIEVPRVDESRHAEHHAAEVAPREVYTAQLVGKLREVMYPLIEQEDLRRVHDLEDAVIPCVVEMEKNAAPIDVLLLKQWCAETEQIVNDGLKELTRTVGFQVNPDSNDDWQRLFAHFGIPHGGETEGGKPSFTDKILKGIDNQTVQLARKVGKVASLRSKFLTAYDQVIGPDNLLRFQLHQLRTDEKGTVRGRFSASEKNIQQVINHDTFIENFGSEEYFIRKLFIPRTGLIAAFDAMQIEFRLFASYSDSPRLLKAYADDPLVSFHRVAESILKPFRSDMPYTKIKSMNFLFVYGGGKGKAASYLELPRAISDQFCDIYHQAFPEVKTLGKKAEHLAVSRGYVKSVLGRRARFPDPNYAYKALNAVIQPSAADIFKQKVVEVHAERKRTGFVMRMPVHDELVGDVPDQESAKMVAEILNRQSFPQIKVPILWSMNTGANWAECK